MLRKLVLLGLFAGGSASVPVLYQTNPELFHGAVRSALEEKEPPAPPQRPLVVIHQARAEPPQQVTGRRVRLEADGQGHFSGEFRINGRPLEALVDTGATMVIVNRSTARRFGINLNQSDFVHPVGTANGTIHGASARLESVQIGRIHVKDVQAMVLEDRALASGALIGMSFLGQLKSFRVENRSLVMEQ